MAEVKDTHPEPLGCLTNALLTITKVDASAAFDAEAVAKPTFLLDRCMRSVSPRLADQGKRVLLVPV